MTSSMQNLIVSCIFQATMITANMTIAGIGVELFPTTVNGIAVCLILFSGRIGAVLSNILFGYLVDSYCGVAVLVVSVVVFLGGLLCLFIPSDNNRTNLPIQSDNIGVSVISDRQFRIGGSSAIIYAFAGEFHDNYYRPKVVSYIATFVAIGNMYLPGMAWVILPYQWNYNIDFLDINFRPWRLLMIIYATPSLISAILVYILPESPKYLLCQGENEEVLRILQKMYRTNTGKDKTQFPVGALTSDEAVEGLKHEKNESMLRSMWKQTVPLFSKGYILKTAMVSYLHFAIFLSTSAVIMWYPQILDSMSVYGNIAPVSEVTMCKAILFDGADYENRIPDNNLASDITRSIAHLSGHTYVEVALGVFLVAATGVGIVNAIVVELYPTQIRGMALAVSLCIGRFGAMTGSNIGGPLMLQLCDYMFYVFAGIHLLVVIIVLLLPKKKPDVPKIDTDDVEKTTSNNNTECDSVQK
nr:unnamed protein product [Callosobruchus chinensis]